MAPSIERRLVGGVWQTVEVNEGGGGPSGPVTAADIDSTPGGAGEVLTADGAGAASWEPSGGSIPGSAVWKDLGTLSVDDVLTDVATVYTPGAGELVTGVRFLDVVLLDVSTLFLSIFSGIRYGPIACIGTGQEDVIDTVKQASNGNGEVPIGGTIDSGNNYGEITAADPLILGIAGHDTGSGPAVPWTPNTVKDTYGSLISAAVSAAGHFWQSNSSGGTTGAVEPDFAGNIGGDVLDNDITWTDAGALPTVGEARVLIETVTPDPYP